MVGGLWLSQGGERGWLGAPRMPLYCGLAGGGCYQHFAGGSIYWTQATGAHAVRGAIRDRWAGEGWETGRLGYPTSGEFCGLREGGCGQRFVGGYIYYHPSAGTRAVLGAIRFAYAGSGWEAGPLGYPTSDEFCGLVQGGCGQRFQRGLILWSLGTGPHPVRGAILDQYAGQGYERGRLGYPRAAEATRNGVAIQRFQNGELSFSFASNAAGLVNGGYPDHDATPCGAGLWCKFGYRYSPRGFAYRNCTDFVAWRKGMVWSQINGGGDGNARGWRQGWLERGRAVSNVPRVGSIAWWGTSHGGGYGHVGIVVAVHPNGSVNVEHYNYEIRGGHSITRNIRAEAYLH